MSLNKYITSLNIELMKIKYKYLQDHENHNSIIDKYMNSGSSNICTVREFKNIELAITKNDANTLMKYCENPKYGGLYHVYMKLTTTFKNTELKEFIESRYLNVINDHKYKSHFGVCFYYPNGNQVDNLPEIL